MQKLMKMAIGIVQIHLAGMIKGSKVSSYLAGQIFLNDRFIPSCNPIWFGIIPCRHDNSLNQDKYFLIMIDSLHIAIKDGLVSYLAD